MNTSLRWDDCTGTYIVILTCRVRSKQGVPVPFFLSLICLDHRRGALDFSSGGGFFFFLVRDDGGVSRDAYVGRAVSIHSW